MLWIGLFAGFSGESVRLAARAMTAASIAVLLILVTSSGTREELQQLRQPAPHENWIVAERLVHAGVHAGARVAVANPPYMCYWARLANVRIAAEVMNPHGFWALDAETHAKAEAALRRFGIRAIVAEEAPDALPPGWESVDETSYSFRVLPVTP